MARATSATTFLLHHSEDSARASPFRAKISARVPARHRRTTMMSFPIIVGVHGGVIGLGMDLLSSMLIVFQVLLPFQHWFRTRPRLDHTNNQYPLTST